METERATHALRCLPRTDLDVASIVVARPARCLAAGKPHMGEAPLTADPSVQIQTELHLGVDYSDIAAKNREMAGGGYAGISPDEAQQGCRWLASLGVLAFALRYRLPPDDPWPAALEDATAAVQRRAARL